MKLGKSKTGINLAYAVRWLHANTPSPLRFVFAPGMFLKRYYGYLLLDQWILEGKEVSSQERLAILYTGMPENKSYLANLAYGESFQDRHLGKTWLWKGIGEIERDNHGIDLFITDVPKTLLRLFHKNNGFSVPCWVRGKAIDTSMGFYSNVKSKSLKSNLRRVMSSHLTCERSKDPLAFSRFYHEMYVPYVRKAYGSAAILDRYEDLTTIFRRSRLYFIKKEDEQIAGGVVYFEKGKAKFRLLGVKDGNSDLVQQGAITALYQFILQALREDGYKAMDVGGSRAFLNDGLLRHKRSWSLSIGGEVESAFVLYFRHISEGLKRFLINNPFIVLDKDGFKGVLFLSSDESLSAGSLRSLYKRNYMQGMKEVLLFYFSGRDAIAQAGMHAGPAEQIEIASIDSRLYVDKMTQRANSAVRKGAV